MMNPWTETSSKISPVPIEMIITERLRPYEKAGKEETMKFQTRNKMSKVEVIASEFNATMSRTEKECA
jgi:hypothetical protein